jgi:hypothetical protein
MGVEEVTHKKLISYGIVTKENFIEPITKITPVVLYTLNKVIKVIDSPQQW